MKNATHFAELNVSFWLTSWLSSWDLLSCVGIPHEIVLIFFGIAFKINLKDAYRSLISHNFQWKEMLR